MSNSESSNKYHSDTRPSAFLFKDSQPFISMIKHLMKTKTVSPSHLSQEHSISTTKTKMKTRINVLSHKASLSNILLNNCKKEVKSPEKETKKLKQKQFQEAKLKETQSNNECILSYDHFANKDDNSSMNSINKCASYSNLSSLINMTKIQRLERKLSNSIRHTKTIDDNSSFKQTNTKLYFNIYIQLFDEAIKVTHPAEQRLLNKIKQGIEKCFSNVERTNKEIEDEVSFYKKESNYNKRLCEQYCNIIKEYQKKTQETDYKIQFNNHILIDDNEDTDTNHIYHKTKQIIINNQSSLCSRNQCNPVINTNITKEFSTNELESIYFADKVTMVKMNSLLSIPKLNIQKCKQEANINPNRNQNKQEGIK